MTTQPASENCTLPSGDAVVGQGSSSQVKVALGWRKRCFVTGDGKSHQCVPEVCPAGRHGTNPPSGACVACHIGQTSFQGSLSCSSCESGKYADKPSSPSCSLCDVSDAVREYAPTPGSAACLICPRGTRSTGVGCLDVVDPLLPVPCDVVVLRDGVVSWSCASVDDDDGGVDGVVASFDVRYSRSGRFSGEEREAGEKEERNETEVGGSKGSKGSGGGGVVLVHEVARSKEMRVSLRESPLWFEVVHVQVRSVGRTHVPGEWSRTSAGWSVVTDCANSSDRGEYLDVGWREKNHSWNPKDYKCVECPPGGSCNGSFLVDDVYTKFGWWECVTKDDDAQLRHASSSSSPSLSLSPSSTTTTTTTTTTTLRTPPPIFSRCRYSPACMGASNSDMRGKFFFKGANHLDLAYDVNTNVSQCAVGYLNPPRDNPHCKTCAPGYVRVHDDGLCSPCPTNGWALAAPTVVIVCTVSFLLLLIALKVRSSGSKKAPHSVMRRTLLHHLQTLVIILSMNVQWPDSVVEIISSMGSVTSTENHIAAVKCASITWSMIPDPLGHADAGFSYVVLTVFALVPFVLTCVGYCYWLCVAPRARCLRCGVKTMKDSGFRHTLCGRRKSGGKSGGKSDGKSGRRRRCCCCHCSGSGADAASVAELPPRPRQRAALSPRSRRLDWSHPTPQMTAKRGRTNWKMSPKTAKKITTYFRKSTSDSAMATAVLLIYLFYPSIVRLGFSTLECVHICGGSYLQVDLQETCWVARHLDIVLFVSIPTIVFFALLLPLGCGMKLRADRHKLRRSDRSHSFRYGMLYSGYNGDRWWWEIIIWSRKLAMILVVTFCRAWVRQLHLALAIMVVSLHLQHYGAPFENETVDGRRLHQVEISSLVVLSFMCWAAVFFTFNRSEQTEDSGLYEQRPLGFAWGMLLSFMLCASNVVFVSWNLWLAIVAFNKKENVVAKVVSGLKKIQTRTSTFFTGSSLGSAEGSGGGKGSDGANSLAIGVTQVEIDSVYGRKKSMGGGPVMASNPMAKHQHHQQQHPRDLVLDRRSRRAKLMSGGGGGDGIELTVMTSAGGDVEECKEEKTTLALHIEDEEEDEEENEEEQDDEDMSQRLTGMSGVSSSADHHSLGGGDAKCKMTSMTSFELYGSNHDRWVAVWDEENEMEYFYCERTGESTWDAPFDVG